MDQREHDHQELHPLGEASPAVDHELETENQAPQEALATCKVQLEDYYEKEIHHGWLYPNLDTLVDKGLVEKGQEDRRTNFYRVTKRGQRELEARRDWENQYVGELLED